MSRSVQSESDILEASKFGRTAHSSDQVHNFLHFLICNAFPHCQHFYTRLDFILKDERCCVISTASAALVVVVV